MKPRCPTHNRTLRWQINRWICRVLGCRHTDGSPGRGPATIWAPKHPGVRTMKDGREVCSEAAKRARWIEVWQLDGGRCAGCGKRLDPPYSGTGNAAEIHHKHHGRSRSGRGMGGGRRDDRIFVDGRRNLEAMCGGPGGCHAAAEARPEWTRGGAK